MGLELTRRQRGARAVICIAMRCAALPSMPSFQNNSVRKRRLRRSLLACVPVTHATPGTPGAAGRCATAAEATRPAARGIGQGRPDAPARPRLYRRPDQIRPILLDDAIAAGGGARHGQCILLRTWGVYKLSATAWGRRISLLGTSQFS